MNDTEQQLLNDYKEDVYCAALLNGIQHNGSVSEKAISKKAYRLLNSEKYAPIREFLLSPKNP